MVAIPVLLLCGLAGLAALPGRSSGRGGGGGGGGADALAVIGDDSHFFGQSPAVYPSPEISNEGEWSAAIKKAMDMVANMTVEEKVVFTGGADRKTACVGEIANITRLDFPGICLSDAGQGLRRTDFVSSFPSGIHVGASWNKNLTRARGAALGQEFRKKGVNVLLGPVVGPIGRVITSGRNWEGISVDPYLSGVLVSESVIGIQDQGVITSTKHFVANEQETNRNPFGSVEALSSNIDDKTMHELYLWPFQDAVKAGTGNIMCSYQRINNSYGCANSKTMNGLLKTELGFQGFVVSDWNAQHAGVATALAGLDMVMPSASDFWGSNLTEAVKNGSVPETRLNDMVTRILATWFHINKDDFPKPGFGMTLDVKKPHDVVDARDPGARPTLISGAIEGHVLVKNTKNTLPLKSPRLLSLFGYSAKAPDAYNVMENPTGDFLWQSGAEASNPALASTNFNLGFDVDQSVIAGNGTLISGGGSGGTAPSVYLSPAEAIKMRAASNYTAIYHDFRTPDPFVDAATDACIVFGNAWASEGYDRPAVRDDYTDGLIKHVADRCNKTIVVLHNAGIRLVDQFINHENVTAVIFGHLPGQETGAAIVSILYGDVSPSGKLPYTVAKNESDYGDLLNPAQPEGIFENFPQSDFEEGVYIDYRRFDKEDIEPRFEFGFGLSYTTFALTNLQIQKNTTTGFDEYPVGAIQPGGQVDLWDVIVTVSADLSNTGDVDAAEVVQLYVGIPDGPAKQLRGFEKPFLKAGENVTVELGLTRRDLSIWDTVAQKWQLQQGEYGIFVGNSSKELPLKGKLVI